MFVKLALKSLLDRKGSVILALMAMTVSTFILLSIDHIHNQAKASFSNTISGTDLIVGSKTSSLNLLLYSVFRIGSPTNNISWQSFETISADPNVKWSIPISLGDSHRGFRVLGTNQDYFRYFSYGEKHSLAFKAGREFDHIFDVVIGSEIATKLNYKLGDKLVLAHGIGNTSFHLHAQNPFTIVGILAPTGTPVDRTLHVSLQGIESIHLGSQHDTSASTNNTQLEQHTLQPKSITALMLGLKSKISTFKIQRSINDYTPEPLIAIIPGVVLSELWQMMATLENTLRLISILVFISACLGVCAMLLSSIRERANEIQLLRVIGAPAHFLLLLIELEVLFITFCSIVISICLLAGGLVISEEYLIAHLGLHINADILSESSLYLIAAIFGSSMLIGIVPYLSGYRQSTGQQY